MFADPRRLSLWHETADDDFTPRPALAGDAQVDVAIVGAGYTGLWTAWHLLATDPTLRVMVLEKEVAGFGASGRNGGWCSALFPTSLERLASVSDRDSAIRMQRELHDVVPRVGAWAASNGVDIHFDQGGYLGLARNPAQQARIRDELAEYESFGFGAEDHRPLSADETKEYAAADGVLGGVWTPHCASLHPARLVRGLARAVERAGGVIHEQTQAIDLAPRRVTTRHGTVRADHVILATEGYTPRLRGHRRDVAPVYSLMTATEPLSESQWAQIGLATRPTFSDARHLVIYGQRTRDGRIAFGGRGALYHFGSRIDPAHEQNPAVHGKLQQIVRDLFPVLGDVRFTHTWGGNLGVPRDWFPSVRLDRDTGFGMAGGYVGDGVATSALAGETLAALITGADPRDLTTLPWVGHRSPRWEVEPLRWLGVNAVTALMSTADRTEARSGQPSKAASLFWRFVER